MTCLRILTDDYRILASGYKVIHKPSNWYNFASPTVIMLIYHSGPLLPALEILANDCHKPAFRYLVIISHLASMILPSLLHPSSNDALLWLFADYYRIQAARYSAILEDLTGQISQTLLYLINPETSRRLSSFCFLVTPIYHSCLLLPISCQIQASRYPMIIKGLPSQISQTLPHLINHEPSR